MGFRWSNVVKVAGIALAPVTGGASLALTTAAVAHDENKDAQSAANTLRLQSEQDQSALIDKQKAAQLEVAKAQNNSLAGQISQGFFPGSTSEATTGGCSFCKYFPMLGLLLVALLVFRKYG